METPALVLDTSSTRVQVGLWRDGQWAAFDKNETPPLDSLHGGIQKILTTGGVELKKVAAVVYCEGPGSILGIRVAMMALNAWRSFPYHADTPVYTYRSLPMAAAILRAEGTPPPFTLLSDYRQGEWNCLQVDADGQAGELSLCQDADLTAFTGPVFRLPQRKGWRKPPDGVADLDYDLSRHTEPFGQPGLLRPVDSPTLYQAREPEFAKWEGAKS